MVCRKNRTALVKYILQTVKNYMIMILTPQRNVLAYGPGLFWVGYFFVLVIVRRGDDDEKAI
jgi:hypothetical protein